MTQHKWAKEIHAWADGAEIEYKRGGSWYSLGDGGNVNWDANVEFRIKPQHKEPQYLYVYHTTKGIELGYAPHNAMNMYNTKLVGKIKLEEEE